MFKTNTPMPLLAAPIRWPNPLQALRRRREARAALAAQQARLGTPLQALNFALDGIDHVTERSHFLSDWREGALEEWGDYRPNSTPRPLGRHGLLIRGAALVAGFFGALLLLNGLHTAAFGDGRTPGLVVFLVLLWAASVLICVGAAWSAAPRGGEG